MPRPPRLHVPGGCYHAVLRGNHREALFSTSADRLVLNEIVGSTLQRFQARLHAFCWMTNHLHALIQIQERPLGGLMQRIAMRYSRYRHKTLRTTGHLFERRYRAWLVDIDTYFLTLLRYIHLNPVKARMVEDPAEYPWSSHRAYLGLEHPPWITTEFGLGLFSTELGAARVAYRQFINVHPDSSYDTPENDAHPDDPRIIGDDRFLANLPTPRFQPRKPLTLDQLAAAICENHGLTLELLRSPVRRHPIVLARVALLREALHGRIATLTEVARFLGRNPSSLSKLLARHDAG